MHSTRPIPQKDKVAVALLAGVATVLGFILAFALTGCEPEKRTVFRPVNVVDTTQLQRRHEMQWAISDEIDAFFGFAFTDRLSSSGIQFRHRIVDDAGIAYKMVHYDHGNGLSIADVDNDGFLDIYFVNQIGANELWRNLGDGSFENVTRAAGVGLDSVVCVSASFADIDNDGDQDLFVTAVRDGNFLFENDGSGKFTDVTDLAGLRHSGHSSGALFFDYDRDGLLDLFLTNVGRYTTGEKVPVRGRNRFHTTDEEFLYYVGFADSTMGQLIPERYEPNVLYRNEGNNRFVDVTETMGVAGEGWSGDAVSWDVNEDGWPDLYVLNMNGDDEYFENRQGQEFELMTIDRFGGTPFGSMGATTLDFDNDGRTDLYLTDMHSDMWETNRYISPVQEKQRPERVLPIRQQGDAINIFGNALFRNEGGGRFSDVALEFGAETYWPWGVSVGDVNADGYDDLFVTASMNYPFRYAVNSLLLNNLGSTFVDSEFLLGIEPRRDNKMATPWFDLDCTREAHPICRETGVAGKVEVWGAAGSRASAIFDLENDGDLDIVTGEFNDRPMVLVSDLSKRKSNFSFLKIDLVGTRSNRDGRGAVVRVYADSLVQTKVYDGKSGYLSQGSFPLYFGLGTVDAVDRIDVTWPSGLQDSIRGPIDTNRLIEIVEGDERPVYR